ncbi:MAG: hypothetical protein M1838_003668 [Thelocarpon superellum]|nr:MAG: hypothetical protein M1838_003668 [Thelocarpon superellum]
MAEILSKSEIITESPNMICYDDEPFDYDAIHAANANLNAFVLSKLGITNWTRLCATAGINGGAATSNVGLDCRTRPYPWPVDSPATQGTHTRELERLCVRHCSCVRGYCGDSCYGPTDCGGCKEAGVAAAAAAGKGSRPSSRLEFACTYAALAVAVGTYAGICTIVRVAVHQPQALSDASGRMISRAPLMIVGNEEADDEDRTKSRIETRSPLMVAPLNQAAGSEVNVDLVPRDGHDDYYGDGGGNNQDNSTESENWKRDGHSTGTGTGNGTACNTTLPFPPCRCNETDVHISCCAPDLYARLTGN